MEIVKYDIETAVITALDAKYADVKIVDAASYAFVMSGLREYREHRLAVDDWYHEKKKSALEYTNALGDERRRVKGLLEPGEQHLKDVRQAEDDRKAAIQAEKDRIEKERVDTILFKIECFEKVPLCTGLNSDSVASMCDKIVAVQITEEVYQEFTEKAKEIRLATLTTLEDIYNDKVIQEKEAAERKAEIEKIEKLRAEQAEAEVKMHEELRKIEAEKQAAQKIIDDEREKLEAEKRAEQEKQDRAEFRRKVEEDFKIQVERNAKEKAERLERERIEAEKEAKHQQEMLPDKEKLISFADFLVDLKPPVVKSKAAKEIIAEIDVRLADLRADIRVKVDEM